MTVDEATKTGSAADANLPAGFEAAISKAGRTYYIDHKMKTTSWTHPLGAKFSKPLTEGLPLPYQRDFDPKGRAYYMNHDSHTTSWLNPVKLAELKAAGVLDVEADELAIDGKAGDEWPWIVKEVVDSGPHKGEEYWVNYRRGPNGFVDNRSPEDVKAGYLAATPAREARERKEDARRDAKL